MARAVGNPRSGAAEVAERAGILEQQVRGARFAAGYRPLRAAIATLRATDAATETARSKTEESGDTTTGGAR